MATYTMELWEVIELQTDSEGLSDIGLSDYPIFDPAYRAALNAKIIDHFWNREIGQESISMFTHQLRRKMHEIMPYWNKHYVASQIVIDPLKTVSMKTLSGTEGLATVAGVGESTSTSDAKSRAVASTLPQVQLSGNGDYAESAQDNISNSSATGNTNDSQTTNSTASVDSETSGYNGNPAILIAEYRATMVNTDMDVIGQLETLFMGIWDSSDDYFNQGVRPYYGYYGFSF
jgi:hypothetical protein